MCGLSIFEVMSVCDFWHKDGSFSVSSFPQSSHQTSPQKQQATVGAITCGQTAQQLSE